MVNRSGADFSFSGLKTAVMLVVRKARENDELERVKADIAASFQRAAVDTLIAKTLKVAKTEHAARLVVAGGVGANQVLREDLAATFAGRVYYPRPALCTDNGAMIAIAGALRLASAGEAGAIQARARWSLDALQAPVAA